MITDEEAYAILAIHAINELYVVEECCPECCYPCDVLRRLSEPGRLKAILEHAPADLKSCVWADGDLAELFTARWTRTDCHDPEEVG